jgi:hypothetical protein
MCQDLVEESLFAAGRLLSFRAVLVEERVFGQTSLADDLRHLPIDHAGDGVIQQQPASRAMVVNQIAQAWHQPKHHNSFGRLQSPGNHLETRSLYRETLKIQTRQDGSGDSSAPNSSFILQTSSFKGISLAAT